MHRKASLFTLLLISLLCCIQNIQAQASSIAVEHTAFLVFSDDARVISPSPNSNYGSGSYVSIWTQTNDNERSFMKVSIPSFPATPSSAHLIMYVKYSGGKHAPETNLELRQVSNDTWNESTITWNNQPDMEDLIEEYEWSTTDVCLSFDITTYFLEEYTGDGVISLGIKARNESYDSTQRYFQVWSTESQNGLYIEVSYDTTYDAVLPQFRVGTLNTFLIMNSSLGVNKTLNFTNYNENKVTFNSYGEMYIATRHKLHKFDAFTLEHLAETNIHSSSSPSALSCDNLYCYLGEIGGGLSKYDRDLDLQTSADFGTYLSDLKLKEDYGYCYNGSHILKFALSTLTVSCAMAVPNYAGWSYCANLAIDRDFGYTIADVTNITKFSLDTMEMVSSLTIMNGTLELHGLGTNTDSEYLFFEAGDYSTVMHYGRVLKSSMTEDASIFYEFEDVDYVGDVCLQQDDSVYFWCDETKQVHKLPQDTLTLEANYTTSQTVTMIAYMSSFWQSQSLKSTNDGLRQDSNPYIQDTNATITALQYSAQKLSFTISAETGESTSTEVYYKDKPQQVLINNKLYNEDDCWTYNGQTQLWTLFWTHSSTADVEIVWGGGASGYFLLTVHLTEGGQPLTDVTVTVHPLDSIEKETHNRTTGLLGLAQFELPYGTYLVKARHDDKLKTLRVWLTGNKDVGLEFGTPPVDPRGDLILIAVFVVIIILYFALFRRR